MPGDCTSSRVQARLLQAGVGFAAKARPPKDGRTQMQPRSRPTVRGSPSGPEGGAVSALDIIRIARAAGGRATVGGLSLVPEARACRRRRCSAVLRAHKPEILELLQAERRVVLRHIADHFQSSPLGQCAHCGGGSQSNDPFVILFVGEDRADIHASCYPRWLAEQEWSARKAVDASSLRQETRP